MIGTFFYIPYRYFFIWAVTLYKLIQFASIRLTKGKAAYPKQDFLPRLFESLSGTFIKVGQAFSVRYDILSPEQCAAFAKLQDQVKTFSPAKGVQIIERELGPTVAKRLNISPTPFASASFSQVYRATDDIGNQLAIKVKRPLIHHVVYADTSFLKLVQGIIALSGTAKKLGLVKVIDEIVQSLRDELDYKREVRSLQLFYQIASQIPFYRVPKVFPNYSTQKILAMEFLDGVAIKQLISQEHALGEQEFVDQSGQSIPLNKIGQKICEITYRCMFEIGIFHADPHPGNILVMANGQMGYVDFGITGTLNKDMRNKNMRYLYYLSQGDTEAAAEAYTNILIPTHKADREGLINATRMELEHYLFRINSPDYVGAEKSAASLYINSIRFARQYGFRLPSNVYLFYKTLFTLDNVLINVDPAFDTKTATERIIKQIYLRSVEAIVEPNALFDKAQHVMSILYNSPETISKLEQLVDNFNKHNEGAPKDISYFIQAGLNRVGTVLILASLLMVLLRLVDWPSQWFIQSLAGTTFALFSAGLFMTGLLLRR